MRKVNSFFVDHVRLKQGIYLSEVNGCFTYDLRFCEPSKVDDGIVMTPEIAHTLEHFLAYYFRHSEIADNVIYVGPMGCLTGFYLVTNTMFPPHQIGSLLEKAVQGILTSNVIPGASITTCGNYKFFDLEGTRAFCTDIILPFLSSDYETTYPLIRLL